MATDLLPPPALATIESTTSAPAPTAPAPAWTWAPCLSFAALCGAVAGVAALVAVMMFEASPGWAAVGLALLGASWFSYRVTCRE